jgi:hypothetical protein
MLRDPGYATTVADGFAETVLTMHRSFHGWPRRLGTAFWSVAHHLRQVEGVRYTLRPAYLRPGRAFDRLHASATRGLLAGLYVGTGLLPKHVTLVIGTAGPDLRVFDPGDGSVRTVTREQFTRHRTGLGGWPRAWSTVVPTR